MSSKNISEFKQNIVTIRNNFIDQIINAFSDFYFGIDKSRKDLEISIIDIQTLGNKLSETLVKQVAENFNSLLKSFTKDVADLETVYIKRLSNNEFKISELQSNIEQLTQMISNLDLKNKSLNTQLTEASEKILNLSEQNKKFLLVQNQTSLAQSLASEQKLTQQGTSNNSTATISSDEKLEPQKLLFSNLVNKISQYETVNVQQSTQIERQVTELSDLRKTLAVRDQEVEHYRTLVDDYRSKYDEEVIKNQNLLNEYEEKTYQPPEPKTTLAALQNVLSSKTGHTVSGIKDENNQIEENNALISELKTKILTYEQEIQDLKKHNISSAQTAFSSSSSSSPDEKVLQDLKDQNIALSQKLATYEKVLQDLKEQHTTLLQKETSSSSSSSTVATITEPATNVITIKEFYRKELDSIPKYQILFRLEKTGVAKVEDLRKILQYSRPAMDALVKDLIKEGWITFSGNENADVKLLKKLP